jgi:restriction system protein
MGIPDFASITLPILEELADSKDHPARELRDALATRFKLSDAERAQLIPSGKQRLFDNRVGWAKTYMDKAGLVTTVRRGVYAITPLGKQILGTKPKRIDVSFLQQFESFRAFISGGAEPEDAAGSTNAGGAEPALITPQERLAAAYRAIRAGLEQELLEAVSKASPSFFETVVVELLVKMGYGGSRQDAGQALGRSGDGGIDGMIKEDHLGLDAIYVQAKRWKNTVGRPDIQAFAGSLEGERARKGVFLTTSTFSKEAIDYVARIEKKFVLVDGQRLASLMVDFGVGVTTVDTLEIKRMDGDYFLEEG